MPSFSHSLHHNAFICYLVSFQDVLDVLLHSDLEHARAAPEVAFSRTCMEGSQVTSLPNSDIRAGSEEWGSHHSAWRFAVPFMGSLIEM